MVLIGALGLFGCIGCDRSTVDDELALKVGVIASLSGPAQVWGEVTVHCAQVTADYYNEMGGVLVDGRRVPIELVIHDDCFDPFEATAIADELVADGVNYVIGPLGDESVKSAAKVLDAAGVLFVHYGFNHEFRRSRSLGILGMPKPEQSLPVLLSHLKEVEGVESLLVIAHASDEGIRQKNVAGMAAERAGLRLLRLSRFDISEESFDFSADRATLENRIKSVVLADPDAILATGFSPDSFSGVVAQLREGGFEGRICAPNFQDVDRLAQLGASSDGVFFVGGAASHAEQSDFYFDLRERYVEVAGTWSLEAETKLYALELILACVQSGGLVSAEVSSVRQRILQNICFEDPFYRNGGILRILGGADSDTLQLETPIRISRIMDGVSVLVKEAMFGDW